jgi:hypothetical protein
MRMTHHLNQKYQKNLFDDTRHIKSSISFKNNRLKDVPASKSTIIFNDNLFEDDSSLELTAAKKILFDEDAQCLN